MVFIKYERSSPLFLKENDGFSQSKTKKKRGYDLLYNKKDIGY